MTLALETKTELHLIPYQITADIAQIGMNGVVNPDPGWINPVATEIEIEKEKISDQQLELPIAEWQQFKGYYGSSALAEWTYYFNLSHPSQLLRREYVQQLPSLVARELLQPQPPGLRALTSADTKS